MKHIPDPHTPGKDTMTSCEQLQMSDLDIKQNSCEMVYGQTSGRQQECIYFPSPYVTNKLSASAHQIGSNSTGCRRGSNCDIRGNRDDGQYDIPFLHTKPKTTVKQRIRSNSESEEHQYSFPCKTQKPKLVV